MYVGVASKVWVTIGVARLMVVGSGADSAGPQRLSAGWALVRAADSVAGSSGGCCACSAELCREGLGLQWVRSHNYIGP